MSAIQRRIQRRYGAIGKLEYEDSPVEKARLPAGNHPDKGKKDGRCNRTACQTPLQGMPQFFMSDHETFVEGKRLYYCMRCADDFNAYDRSIGEAERCTLDEDTL